MRRTRRTTNVENYRDDAYADEPSILEMLPPKIDFEELSREHHTAVHNESNKRKAVTSRDDAYAEDASILDMVPNRVVIHKR